MTEILPPPPPRPNRRAPNASAALEQGAGRAAPPTPPRPPTPWAIRLLKFGVKVALVGLVWLVIIVGSVVVWYSAGLPDLDQVASLTRKPSVSVLAADGTIIANFGDVYGEIVDVKDMPTYLPGAVMAVEDRKFYHHFGVDPLGILRAAVVNLRAGHLVQGGSTLTQQVAKNLFLTQDRTLKRKIQEVIMAVKLERRFTKDQILTLYLNRVYMGAGSYGVDAAAQRYFGVPARKVSIWQAAILAGLLKAPSHYNPVADPTATTERASVVLGEMVEAGVITQEQADSAKIAASKGVTLARRNGGTRYFADWVMQELDEDLGELGQDVLVHTSFDQKIQSVAEASLEKTLAEDGPKHDATQGAVVVMAPDGGVRAMVGGRNYGESQFNRAVQGQRQPGSSFKAFVYLTALENGMHPDDMIEDGPIRINGWSPANFDPGFHGSVSMRTAFAHSLNTCAVRVTESIGRRKVIATANQFGLGVPANAGPSVALGTEATSLLTMTGSYATFANGGRGIIPYTIRSITARNGDILWQHEGDGRGRMVDDGVLGELNSLFSAVLAEGTAKGNAIDHPAGGKTGTTQDFRDAWFIGFTADLVTGVWIGNDDNSPMKRVTGGSLPARVWHDVMQVAEQGYPSRPLPGSAGGAISPPKTPPASDPIGRFLSGFSNSGPPSPSPALSPPPVGGTLPQPVNNAPANAKK